MTHLVTARTPLCTFRLDINQRNVFQVREALTLLDLDVLIYPCPKGGPTYRPKAQQMSGKAQFPFLVDPNTGAPALWVAHHSAYFAPLADLHKWSSPRRLHIFLCTMMPRS